MKKADDVGTLLGRGGGRRRIGAADRLGIRPVSVGRFASTAIRSSNEKAVGTPTAGLHFDSIQVRLTRDDYNSPAVQTWMRCSLFNRVSDARDYSITIIVVP